MIGAALTTMLLLAGVPVVAPLEPAPVRHPVTLAASVWLPVQGSPAKAAAPDTPHLALDGGIVAGVRLWGRLDAALGVGAHSVTAGLAVVLVPGDHGRGAIAVGIGYAAPWDTGGIYAGEGGVVAGVTRAFAGRK